MNWSHFLIAIRWQNVFIIWLMQSVVYFRYVHIYCNESDYSFISFLLFLVATGSVLGAGNIYNDIRDVQTDALHPDKPKLVGQLVNLPKAWKWCLTLVCLSVVLIITGWWIYEWPTLLTFVFLGGLFLLYVYSAYLKATILIGNILVAILCSLSVWMTTLFAISCDLYHTPHVSERIPIILYGYIANAFLITMIREVVKDKEDARADMETGISTIGSVREAYFKLLFNSLLLTIVVLNGCWFHLLLPVMNGPQWYLGLLMIFIPLIMIALLFNLPHKPKIYSFLSKLIKVYILFAILLLILWQRG